MTITKTTIPNCVELEPVGGVRIFDVRAHDPNHEPYRANDRTYYASERAVLILGDNHSFSVSGSGWGDTRNNPEEFVGMMKHALLAFNHQLLQWESGEESVGKGGGVVYKPVAVALANYGWAVICDTSTYRMIR